MNGQLNHGISELDKIVRYLKLEVEKDGETFSITGKSEDADINITILNTPHHLSMLLKVIGSQYIKAVKNDRSSNGETNY